MYIYCPVIMFDINLSIIENWNFFDCDWLQYKNSCHV